MSYVPETPSARPAPIPIFSILGLVTLLVILRGCAAHRVEPASPEACVPVAAHQLEAGVGADALAGSHRLTLVATEGPERGKAVAGTLVLYVNHEALRGIETPEGTDRSDAHIPLIGTLDMDPATVGGVAVGDLTSADPLRPGVAVLVRHVMEDGDTSRTEITIRLGAEANRRDVVRFDGGFLALQVRSIAEGVFRGTWASGIQAPDAKGHFCAVRLEER